MPQGPPGCEPVSLSHHRGGCPQGSYPEALGTTDERVSGMVWEPGCKAVVLQEPPPQIPEGQGAAWSGQC